MLRPEIRITLIWTELGNLSSSNSQLGGQVGNTVSLCPPIHVSLTWEKRALILNTSFRGGPRMFLGLYLKCESQVLPCFSGLVIRNFKSDDSGTITNKSHSPQMTGEFSPKWGYLRLFAETSSRRDNWHYLTTTSSKLSLEWVSSNEKRWSKICPWLWPKRSVTPLWLLKVLKFNLSSLARIAIDETFVLTSSLWAQPEPVQSLTHPPVAGWIPQAKWKDWFRNLRRKSSGFPSWMISVLWDLFSWLDPGHWVMVEVITSRCPHSTSWSCPVDSRLHAVWNKWI